MKSFKYNHSVLVYILLIVVAGLTVYGCYSSIISATREVEFAKILPFVLLAIINLFLFTIVVSIVFFSRYTIKNGNLCLNFGVFFSKISLLELTGIVHLVDEHKLYATYGDGKYIFIVISPKNFGEFVSSIKKHLPDLFYDIKYTDGLKNRK